MKFVGTDEFAEGTYGDFNIGDWYLVEFCLNDLTVQLMMPESPSALTDVDIATIYNGGGDMGVVGNLVSLYITQTILNVNLSFSKVGSGVIVQVWMN